MDRNREGRRASVVGSNGVNRRRHRTNSLRDSPDEDGGVEVQESVRLRDRVKKERDRERDRERDLRERSSRNNNGKRRRAERLADETSKESVNDDEEEDGYEDHRTTTTAAAAVPKVVLTQPVGSVSNHHNSSINCSNNQHRKSLPLASSSSSSKVFRAPQVWKSGDEMIDVPVPRKARSISTKRSHDWVSSSSNNNSGGGGISGGEPRNLRQPSSSPVRQGLVPISPSSSNVSIRKKLKPSVNNSGPKLKPPKSKPSSSNPEELEIEIAEVLYGLMTQSQGPSSKKEDSREVNRWNSDVKSPPKKKRPRQIPENSSSPLSAKPDMDQTPKSEISSSTLDKVSVKNGFQMVGLVNSRSRAAAAQPPEQPTTSVSIKLNSEFKEEVSSPMEKESLAVRLEASIATSSVGPTMIKGNSAVAEMENHREEKFEIDLMAPPSQGRSSPERETNTNIRAAPVDQKPVLSINDAEVKSVKEDGKGKRAKDHSPNEEKKGKSIGKEGELIKAAIENKERNINLCLDLGKSERDGVIGNGSKLQMQAQKQHQVKAAREEPLIEKSGKSTNSLPLPMSMANWPGGLPPLGYMAPLQGVVSMDGTTVTPKTPIQPVFNQPRPKRCATHCHIARNIHYLQQFMKMNPFWPAQDKAQSVASKDKIPPVPPNNLMGPAIIFPFNQQQASLAVRPSGGKSQTNMVASSASATSAPGGGVATAMSFNFSNMAANETQYLAILQNTTYPFPIPAVGAPPNYRAAPGQAMSMFNGPFYSPQMIYPSQIQHQQQPPPAQPPPHLLKAHPNNTSGSNNSSSSQKHSQRPQSSNGGPGRSNLQNFSTQKSQPSHSQNVQSSRPKHLDNEQDSEESPSTASRASMNIYGPNFAMPINAQNVALMAQLAGGGNSSQTEKKALKAGVDSVPPHSFAMSFTRPDLSDSPVTSIQTSSVIESPARSLNPTSGPTRSSRPMPSNPPGGMNVQNLQNAHFQAQLHQQQKQMMQQQQQMIQQQQQMMQQFKQQQQQQQTAVNQMNSSSSMGAKFPNTIAGFPQNLGPSNNSSPSQSPQWNSSTATKAPSSQATKSLPNHHSSRTQPQMHTQISFANQKPSTPSQGQTPNGSNQAPSPSMKVASPTTSSMSVGACGSPRTTNSAPDNNKSGQSSIHNPKYPPIYGNSHLPPNYENMPPHIQKLFENPYASAQYNIWKASLSTSSTMPSSTTPSMSKRAGGSPRTTNSASNNNKSSKSSSFSTQPKNSPSLFHNPHYTSSSSTAKPQMQQQQQQQQNMPPHIQQIYLNPYASAQYNTQSASTSSSVGGYCRRPEQHQQSSSGAMAISSTVGLPLSTSTNDPAKAIAAATCNVTCGVGSSPSQGINHGSQFAGA